MNTKLSNPPTLGNKLYSATPLPKSKVIPKVVVKNDVSKSDTLHLSTNKIIEKCTKVLALGLLKIESEPINVYFKNNRAVYRDYLNVTKEHVATLLEVLEEARALKPLDEHIGLPVGSSMRNLNSWDLVINKFLVTLAKWKGKYLTFGGHLTLIKVVMTNLPNNYFSLFKARTSLINLLKRNRSKFFQHGGDEEKKVSWVTWSKVSVPLKSWMPYGKIMLLLRQKVPSMIL
ncbi:hypothetical protein Tco_1003855 [Tanacetum coccineum]|uniref:Uncharacterized protein n=1 Tax=Tanacetum coccineum TaxID=301880 RepID=A0ABQ5FCJ4_9ASTR